MIKPIVKDTFFLSQKSATATRDDLRAGPSGHLRGEPCGLCRHGGEYDRREEESHYC